MVPEVKAEGEEAGLKKERLRRDTLGGPETVLLAEGDRSVRHLTRKVPG